MISTPTDNPAPFRCRMLQPDIGQRSSTAQLIVMGCVVALSLALPPRTFAGFDSVSDGGAGAAAIVAPGSVLEGATLSTPSRGQHPQPAQTDARIVVHERTTHSWTDVRALPQSLGGYLISNEASVESLLDALRPYAGLEPHHGFHIANIPDVVPGLNAYVALLLIDGSPVIGSSVLLLVDPDSDEIRHFHALNLLHGDRLPQPLALDPATVLSMVLDEVGHHRAATDGHDVEHAYVICPTAVVPVWRVGVRSVEGPKEGEVVLPGESPRIWRIVNANGDVREDGCSR